MIYWDPSGHAKDSDNEELERLIAPYTEKWNEANAVVCTIKECHTWVANAKKDAESKADALRVSYYGLKNEALPSDVIYRDKGLTDVTKKLNDLMIEYEYMYEDRTVLDIVEFYNLVKNGAELDLKNQPGWQETYYVYNREIVDNDVPGNISYGYVGKVFDIPDRLLLEAAGAAQQIAGTSKDEWRWKVGFGDDPRDSARIIQGIIIYNAWHTK